ncbi:hypothetical protein [Streptococcus parasuis]|jgi:endonuclease-3|uniref:endonuclease III domain-containing protein n=1 Tax=Streptococcus TaxID=1301 RepID=UPI0028A80099|nr:hypothetical protein [Streptococcus parasuis]
MRNKVEIEKIYKWLEKNELTFSEVKNDWNDQGLNSTHFKALVSVTLSTMTHTDRVIKAAVALYSVADTPEKILELDDDTLRKLIHPVAHYNRKTIHLKKMCSEIINNFGGEVPSNKKDLLSLTGVGEKCANIMLNFEFNTNSIAVDTHVLRALKFFNIVSSDATAEEASKIINKITPEQYKKHAHERLIRFGFQLKSKQKENPKYKEQIFSEIFQ